MTRARVVDNVWHSSHEWWTNMRQNPLLMAWNVTAFLSVVIPLVVFGINHGKYQGQGGSQDNENNNDNKSGWTWWWQNNNDDDGNGNNNNSGDANDNNRGWWYNLFFGDEEQRRDEEASTSGALIFVYLWTLVLFAFIVYHGHHYFVAMSQKSFWQSKTAENRSFLLVLVLFANLSFVACILVGCMIAGMDERVFEEVGFFAMFASCMLVTYALWTFWASVYCGILYKPSDKEYDSSSHVTSDYQRQAEENESKSSWWGGGNKKESSPTRESMNQQHDGNWLTGWIPGEKEETTGTGIRVKTATDADTKEEDGSMAPFECFGGGSEKSTLGDGRQSGTMV